MSMYGVTVRWSLHASPHGVAAQLRAYVAQSSAAGRDDLSGVHQRFWTLREGGSFAVTSIFATEQERSSLVRRTRAEGCAVTTILGHSPDAIEEFEVLAIAG